MDAVVNCRICGRKSKKSVKIFSCRGRGMGLKQKIFKCLMLSVKRCDQLPRRVCFPCIERLDDFSQYLLYVKQAQVKLRAMLKSQGVHRKDERNVEVNFERGKKRKRKLEEKVYDSSDSYSVSDEFSSTSDEPSDYSATRSHPLKKIALANSEKHSLGLALTEPKRQSRDENTAEGEDGETTGCSVERKETNHPSASSVMPVKEATTQSNQTSLSGRISNPTPPAVVESIPNPSKGPTSESLTFTTSSDATASTVGIRGTNATCLGSSSKSPMASWKGKQMDNLCDIPPLIPITDSLLKQYSNVECQVLPSNVPRSNFSARSEHDIESEPLIIDGLSHTEVHNSDSCTAVDGASAAKKSRKRKGMRSGSYEKSIPSCKSAKWTSGTSIVSDFTANPAYSVVECRLCFAKSYPSLMTLASASDHCKIFHAEDIGSFGCIKCDFTTDQWQQITGQLQSLQHHVPSGCKSSDVSGEEKSPQKKPDDGSGVVEVKQEPVDEIENALLNLKNSLRTVNMPRFRKLIISCGASLGANANTLNDKDARCKRDSNLKEASGNKLFSRQGSSHVCDLCNKRSNSKHQAKVHIARHKPDERARFLFAEQRNCDTELSSTNASIIEDNATGINHSCNAGNVYPKEMVFDIPPIKIEKADYSQQDLIANDNDCSRNDFDSVYNPLILSDNDGVSTEADMAVNAVQKYHDIAVGQTKGGSDTDVFSSSSSAEEYILGW